MTAINKSIGVVKAIGQTLFLFGLFGWVYGVALQLRNLESVAWPISRLTPWLRVDTFTIASFFVSSVGFLIWRLAKERSS